MSVRRSVIVWVVLTGCPQHVPLEPPRDPLPSVGGGDPGSLTPKPAGRSQAEPAARAPDEEAGEGPRGAPSMSAPRGGEDVADVLAPRGQAWPSPAAPAVPAKGCQDGARQAGESWRVDCNTCHCGDDGQVTCTLIACGVTPGQSG